MFLRFSRLSISVQLLIYLTTLSCTALGAFFFWARSNALDSELQRARTVADMTDACRMMVSRWGSVYVKTLTSEDTAAVGRYLSQYSLDAIEPDGRVVRLNFHQKNPFMLVTDYAQMASTMTQATVRMASDNYFNDLNRPDTFELEAMDALRRPHSRKQAVGANDHWEVRGDKLLYARALVADRHCLSCHGDPSQAPAMVVAQYPAPHGGAKLGRGYGYQEGDVVGVTSVTVPHASTWVMLSRQRLGFWLLAAFTLALLAGGFWAVLAGPVRQLKVLTAFARNIAEAEDPAAVLPRNLAAREYSSCNELHQLSHGLNSLLESIRSAMQQLRDLNNKP
ncbi:MAG: DUF3365 domain-containing protein [Rubrivivax sp.]|nr:MAG: DUF3365 domain-containing protein [Rubrivivax sp.]